MNRRAVALSLAAVGAITIIILLARPSSQPSAEPPASATTSAEAPPNERPFIVDVHVHLSADGVARLEHLMKRWEFDHVVNLSGGDPLHGLRSQLAAARGSKHVTVFTTLAYDQARAPGYGERMAEALRVANKFGARGLKIAKVLGLGLRGPDGKLIAVDDPELDPVFEAAGELDMPVAIHAGDPRAFWQPADEKNERRDELLAHPGWALHDRDVPSFDEILAALERRIARHPKTKFISLHFGNCAEDPKRVASWLRKYPNLYIDTAARIPEIGRQPPDEMRAFFIEFQDRILYGSDLGIGNESEPLFLGSEGPEPATEKDEVRFFTATRRYFETADRDFDHPTPIQGKWKISGIHLPPNVLAKVYGKNAMRIIHLDLPTSK